RDANPVPAKNGGRAGLAEWRPGCHDIDGAEARGDAEESMHGDTYDKDRYLKRLRRVEGQVRGLQRMIAEDHYCIDILTQVAAVTRALQSAAIGLLEEHISHCVAQAVAEGGDN